MDAIDTPTLIIFPSLSQEGQDLARSLDLLGKSLGYETTVLWQGTREQYFVACYCATAVVVDASIEEEHEEIFQIVAVLPNIFDHVLTVSRTYLPLNFVPSRPGGVPRYPFPYIRMPDGQILQSFEGYTWDNTDIVLWVKVELQRILVTPSPRLSLETLNDTADDPAPIHRMLRKAVDARNTGREHRKRIFLSYRGINYQAVAKLAQRIEGGDFHGGEKRTVRLVQPGEFAHERELLSEGRRWMIVSMLDDELRACDELWVCRCGDNDNYLESWWTVSELVMASYIEDKDTSSVRISIFDLDRSVLTDGESAFRIMLSEAQRRLIARYLQRPDTMGPENSSTYRIQRWIFRLGLGNFMLSKLEKMIDHPIMDHLFAVARDEQERQELKKDFLNRLRNRKAYRAWINERHFDAQFWNELCVDATQVGVSDRHYSLVAEEFLGAPQSRMVRVSLKKVRRAAATGKVVMAKDGATRVSVVEIAPRYIWKPTRSLLPFRGGLQRLPTYLAR